MSEMGAAIPRVLAIAGSDSGGGAGIQADLKAFARCGVHGMTAITAVTAQNTVGVVAVEPVSPAMIVAQVRAVAEDIGVDAVKIGMLGGAAAVAAVADALALLEPGTPVVLDPVMAAESGAELLEPAARSALVDMLLPRATVVTPNVAEARTLCGEPDADPDRLARAVQAMGPHAAVVTGGHLDRICDRFCEGGDVIRIGDERPAAGSAHGSGCTHSAALAARLAHGDTPLEAARAAHALAAEAVRGALRSVGAGAGPADVMALATARL